LASALYWRVPETPTTWSSRPARRRDAQPQLRSRVFAPADAFIGVPGLTPHDLWHTAASLAVQAGANV
jgi:hypothetical protein